MAAAARGAIAMFEDIGERPTRSTDTSRQLAADRRDRGHRGVRDGRLHEQRWRGRDRDRATARSPARDRLRRRHGERNEAIPFGAPAILDLDAGTLEILEGAVL